MSESNDNNTEVIEGLGEDEDSAWGDYPIDTLLIRHEQRTVHDIVRRIEKGSFVMDPDFQRAFIWNDDKQSKLIESVIMRIPLPVFYLAEDTEGRMIVVDGLQRLSTFVRYVNNNLKLKLPDQPELHTKTFEELSPKLQNRIEDCNLVLYIVDAKVPERARLDIFERVNSGVPLTRQQMRNSLYMGAATKFLKEEAEGSLFRQATGNSLNSDTMRDREFVNRFCAFYFLGVDKYEGNMDEFLAATLTKMNQAPSLALVQLSRMFKISLRNNFTVFGEHAFRKHGPDAKRRGILNASLWDILSVGLTKFSTEEVERHSGTLRERFFALMENEEFISSITYGPNARNQVQNRFRIMEEALTEVFDA